MEMRETLGLDDLGREIVRTCSMNDDKTSACAVYTAYDGEVWSVIAMHEVVGEDFNKLLASVVGYDTYKSISGLYTVSGRTLGKSFMPIQQLPKHQGPIDTISICDENGVERVRMGKLFMRTQQGQPKRKPQPNRGPVGRKDWQ